MGRDGGGPAEPACHQQRLRHPHRRDHATPADATTNPAPATARTWLDDKYCLTFPARVRPRWRRRRVRTRSRWQPRRFPTPVQWWESLCTRGSFRDQFADRDNANGHCSDCQGGDRTPQPELTAGDQRQHRLPRTDGERGVRGGQTRRQIGQPLGGLRGHISGREPAPTAHFDEHPVMATDPMEL